jgi:hypothetical protein
MHMVQPFTLDDLRRIRDAEEPVVWRRIDLMALARDLLQEAVYAQSCTAVLPGIGDASIRVRLLGGGNVGGLILNPAYARDYSAAGGDWHKLIAGVVGLSGMREDDDREKQLLLAWNVLCKGVAAVRLGRSTADIAPSEFQDVVGDAVADDNRELGEFPKEGFVLRGHDDSGERLGFGLSGMAGSEDHGASEHFIGSAFGVAKRLAAESASAPVSSTGTVGGSFTGPDES